MPFQSEAFNAERDRITNDRARSLLKGTPFKEYDVPKRLDENGVLRTWEPEFGPTLMTLAALVGAKEKLSTIPGFKLIPNLRRDFSYVSPTIAMPEGLVGRARFNFFPEWKKVVHSHPPLKTRKISGGMIGVKSDVKSPYRLENEAPLDADLNTDKGIKRLREDHNDTLPKAVFGLTSKDTPMTGLMCVERAGFEGTHLLKDGMHSHLISYAGSLDVGTCHDIRFINDGISSIIANHFESEQEIVALRGPKGMSDDDVASLMEASMSVIQPSMAALFAEHAMPEDDPRIMMGKNSRAAYEMEQRLSAKEVKALNMQPSDLLQRDNLQGLTAIFDDKKSPLMSPDDIHAISEFPIDQEVLVFGPTSELAQHL
jgi:hypothetical protein